MTPDNELLSTSARALAPRSSQKTPPRRRASAVLASLAVIGFSVALMAPTGSALAEPQPEDAPLTAFSLAAADTQSITVDVDGADITPVVRSGFEVYVKPKPKPEPAADDGGKDNGGKGGGGGSKPPPYTGGGSKEQWMMAAGIAKSDWGYVNYIVSKESGWNPNARNKSSGASGLVQALPCSKVPGNCFDPVDNLRWGNGYAVGRYGSWANAYNFWTRNHWW